MRAPREGAGTLLGASMLSMVDSVLTGTLAGPACDRTCDMPCTCACTCHEHTHMYIACIIDLCTIVHVTCSAHACHMHVPDTLVSGEILLLWSAVITVRPPAPIPPLTSEPATASTQYRYVKMHRQQKMHNSPFCSGWSCLIVSFDTGCPVSMATLVGGGMGCSLALGSAASAL